MKLLCVWFLALAAAASIPPRDIPRHNLNLYQREGVFEGGTKARAVLDGIQAVQSQSGTERWTLLFSDETGRLKNTVPRFQIRFEPEETLVQDGEPVLGKPPRLVITLQGISDHKILPHHLSQLSRSSKLVREAVLYPPIEDGDRVLELILAENVAFETFQPTQKTGQLVVLLRGQTRALH